ncbi:hypothetical protein ACQKQA_10520 [Pseudomonas sp. NPDC089530]|uniref:hypothetical protein n=1 Tax=Pseudomonas sp. NPDC089530 TaxID=3390651 RepID=UPI003D047214
MSRAGTGQSGSFALSLAEFAAQTTEAIDASLREIIIEVGSSLIRMSPVGNPEIWAQNAVARQYNKAVDDHNSDLRNDPAIGRQATTLCHWCLIGGYRGPNCGYTGGYVDQDGLPTTDPEKDECDAPLGRGCIPRFGEGNELPFGGFPAVSLIARS